MMRKRSLSGRFTACLISLLLVLCMAGNASACSLFYFGGEFTDDGANLFLRVEDQDGAVVPLYNQLKLKEKVSVGSLAALLHQFPLGYWENEETHLYRFYPEADLQQELIAAWPDLSARIAAESDSRAREEIMTAEHMRMSEEAHGLALALYRHLVRGEPFGHSGAGQD